MTKHTAKKIRTGLYNYRGWKIENLQHWDNSRTCWNMTPAGHESATDSENTLKQCKAYIDSCEHVLEFKTTAPGFSPAITVNTETGTVTLQHANSAPHLQAVLDQKGIEQMLRIKDVFSADENAQHSLAVSTYAQDKYVNANRQNYVNANRQEAAQ